MKKLVFIMLLMLASCSSDDDSSENLSFYGSWELQTGTINSNAIEVNNIIDELVILENGYFYSEFSGAEGTYVMDGNDFIIEWANSEFLPNYTMDSFSGNTLVLTQVLGSDILVTLNYTRLTN